MRGVLRAKYVQVLNSWIVYFSSVLDEQKAADISQNYQEYLKKLVSNRGEIKHLKHSYKEFKTKYVLTRACRRSWISLFHFISKRKKRDIIYSRRSRV